MVAGSHTIRTQSAPQFFPPVEYSGASGLVGVGGELSIEWLLDAYRHGIFPWPLSNGTLAWWSPDPRAVIDFDRFHVSRRLQRTCSSGLFEVTCNRDFRGVIAGCATVGDRLNSTWLTAGMQAAYIAMHERGMAHSIETWRNGELAGGVYGVAIGGYFAAESMFHYQRDASKVALVALVAQLRASGFALLDIQQLTPHTARFGAAEIPREDFLSRLAAALDVPASFTPATSTT